MARVHLALPERFDFTTSIDVRLTDMNYGGHMGNEMVLAYAHEARDRFFRSLGYSELDVEGCSIIMADAVVIYRSEVFAGDRLNVHIGLTDFNKYGCDVVYRFDSENAGREAARAKTGIVFYDYEARRIAHAPERFLARFGQ